MNSATPGEKRSTRGRELRFVREIWELSDNLGLSTFFQDVLAENFDFVAVSDLSLMVGSRFTRDSFGKKEGLNLVAPSYLSP